MWWDFVDLLLRKSTIKEQKSKDNATLKLLNLPKICLKIQKLSLNYLSKINFAISIMRVE